ncbi:MAG: SRPBCC family protein [Candidatus Dormibacteraceae bacterium]
MKAKGATTMEEAEYVIEPGQQEMIITRMFDAPRELVYRAFTEPQLLAQWWGPRRYTNQIDKFDVKPGGQWRIVQRGEDGSEHAFRGVHHDAVAPERIVATFEYEGLPGHVSLGTTTFEAVGNQTRMSAQSLFQSVGDRDGMVASGMREGSDESYDRLAQLLEKMKGGKP